MHSEFRQILDAVCVALLLVAGVPLLIAFTAPPDSFSVGLLSLVPDCPSRLAGSSCSLCGMSHAFVAMTSGQVESAREWNAYGPLVFVLFCCVVGVSVVGLILNWLGKPYKVGRAR